MEKLPQRGYNSGEKEELLPKYVQMRRSNSSHVRFCRVFSAEHWQDLLQKLRYLPQHSLLEALRSQEPRTQITADRSEMVHLFAAAGLEPVSLKRCWRGI